MTHHPESPLSPPSMDDSREGLPWIRSQTAAPSPPAEVAGDLLVEVVFRSNADAAKVKMAASWMRMAADAPAIGDDDSVHAVLSRFGAVEAGTPFQAATVEADLQRSRLAASAPGAPAPDEAELPPRACYVRVKFPAGTSEAEVTAALRRLPEVADATKVPGAAPPSALPISGPASSHDPFVGGASIQVDPATGLESQWYLHRLRIPQAWAMSRGAAVVVADIDWGYRSSHQDLRTGIAHTYNAVDGTANVVDGLHVGHGTGVLAIAGARENGIGMQGCAPGATLWAIQADSGQGPSVSNDPWVGAIDHVVRTDAGGRRKVIILEVQTNPAFGNYEQVPSVNRAVRDAIAAGCVVCVAAGNGDRPADRTDAGVPFQPTGSILVGATGFDPHANPRASFSNFGPSVTVCAPGDPAHDLTCGPSSDSAYRNGFGGTSGATPKVAGIVALMLSANPALTHADVRDILRGTGTAATHEPGKPVGVFPNAEEAVAEALRRGQAPVHTAEVLRIAPAATESNDEKLKALEAQVGLMQQLLTSQLSLQVLQQSTGATVDKGVADKLREAVTAKSALEKSRAMAPFAELQGIREAMATLAVAGKEGSITIGKGGDGQLILRFKSAMFSALDEVAAHIVEELPNQPDEYVLASQDDVETAAHAALVKEQLALRRAGLDSALATARMQALAPLPASVLPAVLAGVQTVPVVLDALSNAAKFFRADRQISLFEGGDEAKDALHTLIEARAAHHGHQRRVFRIEDASHYTASAASDLLQQIEALRQALVHASSHGLQIEQTAQAGGLSGRLQSALTALQSEIAASRLMLDSIDPASSPDAFWLQVAGQLKHACLAGRGRIEVRCIGQTAQMLEKRIWRSDRVVACGEVQVTYRILDAAGARIASGIRMLSSTGDAWVPGLAMQASLPSGPKLRREAGRFPREQGPD